MSLDPVPSTGVRASTTPEYGPPGFACGGQFPTGGSNQKILWNSDGHIPRAAGVITNIRPDVSRPSLAQMVTKLAPSVSDVLGRSATLAKPFPRSDKVANRGSPEALRAIGD